MGNIKSFCKNNFKPFLKILFFALPFLITEGTLRIYTFFNVNYMLDKLLIPAFLFSSTWIAVIAFTTYFLNKIWGRIFYIVTFALNFILFLTHLVYHSYTGFFFKFKLLSSADEGSEYIWDTLTNAPLYIYAICAVSLLVFILIIIKNFSREKVHFKGLLVTVIAFICLNLLTPFTMGAANKSLETNTWKNPRNVYENFYDANKCMQICGLSQYTIKDFYTTFFTKNKKPSQEESEFLKETYSKQTIHASNEKSGIFHDKNVIFLQLEGIDSWLLTPEVMPNAYELMSSSINFTNHFSYYCGGGSTFNSELAVMTGHLTPISYAENPYSFTDNTFTYSMPNVFKQSENYSVNAFHMNTGEFYSRELNYKNWNFDNYYGLVDYFHYDDWTHRLDTELIHNEFFYDKMFKQNERFVHYIITYTPHTPFDITYESNSALARKLYGDAPAPFLGEEEVAYLFATETDEMIGLLIQALKDNGLYENTVIVAFADHYLYSLHDKTILDKHKETSNNLINRTPFFIWSYDIEPETVDKVNSQIDVLPTVLNMMGFDFYDESYTGRDIFDKDYRGYVFFSDYSWYDGTYYVENGEVTNGVNADESYIAQTNKLINNTIMKNDLTLKYDYFKKQ